MRGRFTCCARTVRHYSFQSGTITRNASARHHKKRVALLAGGIRAAREEPRILPLEHCAGCDADESTVPRPSKGAHTRQNAVEPSRARAALFCVYMRSSIFISHTARAVRGTSREERATFEFEQAARRVTARLLPSVAC